MASPDRTTINLGNEYDHELWSAIIQVMGDIGATRTDSSCGLGGSQVIERVDFHLGESVIRVEGETYLGVSITGDDRLVAEIAALVSLERRS